MVTRRIMSVVTSLLKFLLSALVRDEYRQELVEAGVRRRSDFYYQQLDELSASRQQVQRELLAESTKHEASKLLCQIPSIRTRPPCAHCGVSWRVFSL